MSASRRKAGHAGALSLNRMKRAVLWPATTGRKRASAKSKSCSSIRRQN